MRNELSITNETGQRASWNRGMAHQLPSWLPDCGLHKLSPAELQTLIEYLDSLVDEAFSCGWQEAMNYNSDMVALASAPDSPVH